MASDLISGIENLGLCVDLVELDPLNITSSCKNIQAVWPKGGDATYTRGSLTVPKGIEMMSPYKMSITGGETLMSNSLDFTQSFDNSITVEGGFGGFGFNASNSVKKVRRDSESRKQTFTYVYATSAIHVVKLQLAGISSEFLMLNADFIDAVKNLSEHDDASYSAFIKTYGTHFLSQVALGGMAWSRVSTDKRGQSSSQEDETELKAGATAELEGFTGKISHEEVQKRKEEKDRKHGITRSEISVVGGTYDGSGVSSNWISSLDGKSVPVHEKLILTALSTLLTDKYFPDHKSIADKKKLLEAATSRYIKQRGGDEGQQIRYGKPIKLLSLGKRKQIHHDVPVNPKSPLFGHDKADAPSGAVAGFEIHGPREVIGEPVMSGDLIALKIVGTDVSLVIRHEVGPNPALKQIAFFPAASSSPNPAGEYSIRITGSRQEYEGQGSTTKRRPLVSGDIVLLSRYDEEVKSFVMLRTDPAAPNRVRTLRQASDPMFGTPGSDTDYFSFIVSDV
ncbi:MAC/perforin domain-containing protein [Variovorax sp. LjRoot178]|uniref:MAC/perforin domain-containing protein n=1 Tax=Variovorax sp. LjRoot178 TaxID=3342277 RepID=UPI003ECFBDEE